MKNKTKQQSFIKQTFLDEKIIQNFRNIINSARIFNNLIKHKNRYNLICAVIDRINSAVIYLNQHSAHPKSEEEFIFFCFIHVY